MDFKQWQGFQGDTWRQEINVRNFIKKNYSPYLDGPEFLCGPTERTQKSMEKLNALLKKEMENGGVLDIDVSKTTTLTSHAPGYLDKETDVIVGLQTDEPLKRAVNPFGGMRMARSACKAYGYEVSDTIEEEFRYTKTHNDGVFSIYTDEIKALRHCALLTGLPDAYGRGRIIGDYRRIALYGVDYLIANKMGDKAYYGKKPMTFENMRNLEELHDQIKALEDLKKMAASYGYDISMPASNAREAIQWTYFGYLGANKEQNGAAMSFGRCSTFFDIYIEKDIKEGKLTEEEAQELIDDLVIKLRMARHLRTPEYNELFGGDPMWITECVGGMGETHKTLVTKTSYRMLNTLYNLGPAPEPNLTVLWSEALPTAFKRFCAKVSIDTASIQYENDDLMRPIFGDDYAIACCVSAMKVGKQTQLFGARTNLAKLLLLAINGGVDNMFGTCVGPKMPVMDDMYLDYEKVYDRFKVYLAWLCEAYVKTMNIIHYSHDRYSYEKLQLALHDTEVERLMAFGIAGFSVIVDSLSAIKYAKVKPIKNGAGLIVDFEIEGDFPKYGNDDDRVDEIGQKIIKRMMMELRKTPAYRDAIHTLSVLTITSNVVYGKKTGATPDGRKAGEAFAPGANPMHNREHNGALASLNSVSKMPYSDAMDGISNTFSIVPDALGKDKGTRINNLTDILDGYFRRNAHHLNVNVLNRETLMDAYENPEKYPNLTIRVSGYAVNFTRLSKEQQREVISRTFHESM